MNFSHYRIKDMPIYQATPTVVKEAKVQARVTKEFKAEVIESKEIDLLREEYEILTGDKPDGRWKEDRIKSEIESHA
jgi:hypothetical protein